MARCSVVALLLLAGCQHDTGQGDASRGEERPREGPLTGTDAITAVDVVAGAGSRRFSACGASFDIPRDWVPMRRDAGHWAVNGETPGADGLLVSVRCLPDDVISPGAPFTGIKAVRDALGWTDDTAVNHTSLYQVWAPSLKNRPGVIAFLQEQDDGPGRIEVAVWEDPRKRSPADPPSKSQGLIAIHWSADDPHQVAQYAALRTQFTSSFSAPLPASGHDRTRF